MLSRNLYKVLCLTAIFLLLALPAASYADTASPTLDILAGLGVNRNGILTVTSVVDLEYWKPLTSISNPVFKPDTSVAMAKQTNDVLTALAVDKEGRLVVASVAGVGIWKPPVGIISDPIFVPGSPVAMAKQTNDVLTALAVDKDGRLVVASVAGLGIWKPPVGISKPIFIPGSAVAMEKQVDQQDLCEYLRGQPKVSGSTITQRISQVTGDYDPENLLQLQTEKDYPHVNMTSRYGVAGVDLGANTEFQGKLVIFFGDVGSQPPEKAPPGWFGPDSFLAPDGTREYGADWVAYTSDPEPEHLHLTSVPTTGQFKQFAIAGIGPLSLGNTPTGAFSYNNQVYVFAFYSRKYTPTIPPGSLLVASADPTQPSDFRYVSELSLLEDSGRFLQVAPWVVKNADIPDLPSTQGDGLILLGQGGPANDVHMAWMPLFPGHDPDFSQVQYYCGNSCWSPKEKDAITLFSTIGYTSLSLAWLPGPKRWLLLYSLASPGRSLLPGEPPPDRGHPVQHNPNGPVVARLGTTPWNWSDEIIVFDPFRENALGKFMHRCPCDDLNTKTFPPVIKPDCLVKEINGECPKDKLAWAGDDGRPGWAYGPFLLNRYNTQWEPTSRVATIYYLLSTSTPYQVQLMRSELKIPAPGR